MIRLAVQDTGVGVPPEALAMIFDAFTQADGSTTRKFGGSGLGLTICRQLVKMMHGDLGVESEPGRGSTFWFKLPLEKQSLNSPGQSCPAFPQLAHKRILVVDDTASYRSILHEQFRQFRVLDSYAASGHDALDVLRRQATCSKPFDLTIIDSDIKDMDGLSLAQAIRADPRIGNTRIILLTSLHGRLTTSILQTTGIAAGLVKPVRQSRLFDTLVDVLSVDAIATTGSSKHSSLVPASLSLTKIKDVRVLIAEDNAVNQRLAVRQLKKLGYYADAVSNGKEVLEALRQVPYDIILMDCQMPEMDGYEVSRLIRQQSTHGTGPYIIALTANALQGDRERCIQAGMNDYLTKPLHLSDLESSLQRALLRVQPSRRSNQATPGSEVLDPAILASLHELSSPNEGDPFKELVELFLKDAQSRLQKMAVALERKEWSQLAAAAHTLKGSANNLGARNLANLLASLEKHAKTSNLTDSANILLSVRSEFQEVESALLAELQKR
jgi:two-component system sensor histidine kinase/response regulator